MERDPFDVPLAEKIDLCLRAEEGMRQPKIKVTLAMVRAQREHKVLVSSDGVDDRAGARRVRRRHRRATRPTGDVTQIRSYPSQHAGVSGQGGWEFVEQLGLDREAPRVGEQAVALLSAPECPAGDDDDRPLAGAGDHAGARVGRPPDRARPRLRHRGRVRGHELPLAGRPRHPSLRLRADERHRRRDDAARARHVRVRRRGRSGAARGDRRGRRAARLPHARARPPRGSAPASAAPCGPTAGAGCRSCG